MKRLDLRLDDEMHAQLTRLAAREKRSAHAQAVLFIENGLNGHDAPAVIPGQTSIAVGTFRPDPKVKK